MGGCGTGAGDMKLNKIILAGGLVAIKRLKGAGRAEGKGTQRLRSCWWLGASHHVGNLSDFLLKD